MSLPVVSICIPSYNYGRYLREALDSALRQTERNIEILVVDNCSDDETPELVAEYALKDDRIKFHRNAKNIGMTANFNRAMELAQGEYIKFLCADDLLAANCVESLLKAITARPGVVLAACGRTVFDDASPVFPTDGHGAGAEIREGRQVIRECFFRTNYIGEPTAVLFRKADATDGFDARYFQALDVDLWFRLLEKGRLAYIGANLCAVRTHDSTGTAKNLRAGKITADKVRLFEQYARKPYIGGALAERLRWDARMASSSAKQAAAGATVDRHVLRPALYHPRFANGILFPLATLLVAFTRGLGS